jgi:predicted CxxxxCH...CXXCH cytochrome family protein
MALFWGLIRGGSPAYGDHFDNGVSDLGSFCIDCHTLNADLADPDTSFIQASSRSLPTMRLRNSGVAPATFGCTYCHNDPTRTGNMKTAFGPFDSKPSQHPVDRAFGKDSLSNVTLGANTYTTLYMSNWDNSWTRPASQTNCVECHDVGSVANYPNHPIPGTDNRVLTVNPFMLKNVTAMDNGHAPNSFCLTTCHAGTAPGTSGYRMGHYGWGSFDNAGTLATLKEHDGTPLKTSKCADCHETHSASVKPNLMGEQRQSSWMIGNTNSYYDPSVCNQCHTDTVFVAAGHGKPGVSLNCGNCHSPSVSHRDQNNRKRLGSTESAAKATLAQDFSTNGLDDDFDGVIDNPGEAALQYSTESTCSVTCHSDKHIHQGTIGGTSGSASCLHCHDPHGKGVDNNIMMVRKTVMGRTINYFTSGTDLFRSDNTSVCDNPSCHAKPLGNTSTPGTIMYDVQEHKDANVGFGTVCTSCHNHSSAFGGDSFAPVCNSCHQYPGQPVLGGTKALSVVHNLHVAADNVGGYGFTCSTCHYKYTHNESGVNNAGEWDSRFQSNKVNIKFDGLWNPKNANGPLYNLVAADNTLADNVYAPGVGAPYTNARCAGLYCHGDSAGVASWPAGTNTRPTWDNAGAPAACGTCHRATAASPPQTFAHQKHADNTTVGYWISCRKCHYPTTSTGTTITSRSQHLNRRSDVSYDTTDVLVASGNYSGTTTVGDSGTTTGLCANIYCHSPGSRTTPPFDNGALGTPDWKQGTLACNACHGASGQTGSYVGMPAYANGSPKANTHGKHLDDDYTCRVCHWTITTTDNTIAGRVNHVNAVYNVVNDNVAWHAFAYSASECSAAACHGGFSSGPNMPVWGQGPYNCGVCHKNTGGAAAAADMDDFSWNSGTMSKIRDSEWTSTGHGRTVGTYNSGRNAANFTGCTVRCHSSSVSHNVTNNPFRLVDNLANTDYNDTVDPRSLKDNKVCLDCHSATGASPSGSTLHVESNHFGLKHSGAGAQTMGGSFCWDCHDPHGDPNDYMIHDNVTKKSDGQYGVPDNAAGSRVAATFSKTNLNGESYNTVYDWGDYVDNVSTVTGLCQVCHSDPAGASGGTSGGAEYFSSTRFTATHNKTAGVQGERCTACHPHGDDFKPGCNGCHGAAGYLYGPPPYAPSSGNQVWSQSVDNVGNLAGVGNHRSWPAQGIALSGHDPFMGGTAGCVECHTGTPGLGATHNVAGEMNATMTNIANHNWYTGAAAAWDNSGTAGATTSVADDSCSNINCHSPYYGTPANQYGSGTPTPYKRYWINSTRWDCYTCHAYDGRTATTRPGGADNTMATGIHGTHVGTLQLACSKCHDVTGYSPSSFAGNHKNGFINWSFAGAPNPYGSSPAYNVANNTAAPTDDNTAAGHRSWDTCSSLYCHSTVQSSPPGSAPTYKTARWDNVLTGNCGTCHEGDGITDNPASLMSTGTHTTHDNTTGYNIGCTACHTGAGTGTSLHADGRIQVPMGTATWRSFTLTGSTTIYDNTTGAPATDDNLAVVGVDASYGKCSAIVCHTNGKSNNPATDPPLVNPPVWGATDTTCTYCHDRQGSSSTLSTRHQKHTDNTSGTGYNYTCDECHATTVANDSRTTLHATTGIANHVDNTLTVSFSTTLKATTVPIGGTFTQGTDNCANTYCHSDGTSLKNSGTIQTNSVLWGTAGPLACNLCHGVGGPASGSPNYATSGTRRNSHAAHVSFGCQTCHGQTTTNGTSITAADNHVNGRYNVSGTGFTYDNTNMQTTGSTCAFTSGCHGTSTVTWGGTLSGFCFACHQGVEAANGDKPQGASNGSPNPVDNNQYTQSGHGRTGSNYPVSNNAPAGMWNSGTGTGCYSGESPSGCHASGAAHIPAPASDPYRLGSYADNTSGLCVTCHTTLAEHTKAITGGTKTWPNSYDWKCVDCHDPHGDGTNASLRIQMVRSAINQPTGLDNANVGSNAYGSPRRAPGWNDIAFSDNSGFAAGSYAIPGTSTWGICEGCHRQTYTYNQSMDNVNHATTTCMACHDHAQGFKSSCNVCHGDINGTVRADGSSFPPEGPTAARTGKTYTWAETQGGPATRGDHLRHAGSGYYNKDCAKCHVTGYGSDAAHNNNKTNATLSAISTYGTWSAGAQAGYLSVTDDSCSNITCHSPYSTENSGNAYMSGTPFAYTRYWVDNVNWNCYTCHAYDGRTQNTGSVPRPGGADNVMSTGSHRFHVDNTQMACTSCHPSGSYTVTHKSGFVNWSFAGSPDPYADAEAYSVASGTRAPTDNAAGRLYGTCSNTYCHSTVQTSPPGGAVTHSTPTWGTTTTGNCGTCHAGNGITDNAASLMSTGTHTTHDNTTGYNVGCTACHTGAGTGTSLHADGRIQVTMGNSTWRSFTLTGSTTIYDNTTGAPAVDDNLAVVGADASYGRCSSIPCHSNGQGGAPLVNPPVWGATDTTCTYCHDRQGSSTTLSTRHQKHTDNTALTGYNYTCDECHATTVANDSRTTLHATTGIANHVDNVLTVSFSTTLKATTVPIGGTFTQGTDNCANTYCHSDGSSIKNGGTIQANSIRWDNTTSPLPCNSCHGNPPAYTSAANRANSHTAHSNYGCQICHSRTTTTGTTITAADNHVNGVYNVSPSGTSVFTYTYNASGSTCAFTSGCHGTSTVTWGGTLTGGCAACHGGTTDANNFGYNDGSLAIIQMTGGWDTTGHGRTTAFPSTASGNPAPNDGTRFGSGATPNCTNYCHDSGQPHTDNNAGSNYFRLATGQGTTGRVSITQGTANNICNQCHTTGGAYAAQATRDIVTAHYGAKHDNTTKNAGNFCWDCHEPHGDANDYMIQAAVASRTDMSTSPGGIGIPLATSAVSFLKSGGSSSTAYDWGDYVGTVSGDTNRLCRVCHDTTVNHFNTSTWDSTHNPGTRCTQCHGDTYKHDINFRGIGTCVGCHSGAQGSSPTRRQVTGATGEFLAATHHVTNYVDNSADGAVQNVDCSKCHWEGYLTGDTILVGRTPAKQGDTNPAFHWTDDANNATAKYVQLRVWAANAAPTNYGNSSPVLWRNDAAYNVITNAVNLSSHCLGCHSSTIGAATPFSDGRSPRVRSWDGTDIGTKYLRSGAANTRATHQYSNTTYNVVPPVNKALSAHYDLQNNVRGVATTGAWANDDTAGAAGTATGSVACFDCHNSHGANVVGTATLPLASYANNASLNAGLSNANVGGLLKTTTAGVSGYGTTYTPVADTTYNWSASSGMCFDCHVGSTAGGTPPKTYTFYNRTANRLVAGYYDPVNWSAPAAGRGVWDNGWWQGSFNYKANNIVVTHFRNDAAIRALQTTPTTQLNGLCSRCHDPHGVSTNATQVSNANYGTPLLKGTWMTSPYFEDRPGEKFTTTVTWVMNSATAIRVNNNVYNGTSVKGRGGPRLIPFRDHNRPPVVGGGYGTTGGASTGNDGFFIDENTFGLTLTATPGRAWDLFGTANLMSGANNNGWRNLWNGGYGTNVTIGINRITETNAQFAGLCERCHTPASLVNTASKAANIITHAHRTVKGWSALGPAAADIFKNFHINNTTNNGTFSQMLHGAWAWNNMAANFSDYRFVEDPGEPWSGFPFHWGVNLNRTSGQFVNNYIQNDYHQFPCSKCHAPHTSRLPRLLRTNCLDTGTVRGVNGGSSNWGTNGSWIQRHSTNATNAYINRFRVTSNATFRWTPARAVRCHQDAYAINGTAANDTRWNDLTPW